MITSKSEIVQTFNKHFSTIANSLPSAQPQQLSASGSRFQFTTIENEMVLELLTTLDERKAAGPDGISARVLKMVAPAVSSSLTTLFNNSLKSGQFPTEWKQANVTPVPKSGDSHLISNYRPISVIPVIAKVFETLIHRQMYEYLQTHKLLNPAQSGFRPNYSTQDVLLRSVDDWKKALDRGEVVGSLFIDLSKAFDSIDHPLLLSKLEAYGVQDIELQWFTDYLEGRRQKVTLEGESSDWSDVTRGVPQGSILGPLLFIIFMNDLPDCTDHCTVNLYADDTTIYVADRDPSVVGNKLNADLNKVAAWIKSNGLKMNVAKTQALVLSRKRGRPQAKQIEISLNGESINTQDSVKYLGIVLDQNLTWEQQESKVRQKRLAGLPFIRRASAYLPSSTKCTMPLSYPTLITAQ